VKVLVEFALRAAKEPLVLAALVVSFRTTVKVSPTLRALLSSNKGLYPVVTPLVDAGNKLPKFAGVKLSGLGRMEVGVCTKVGRSAVAQAPNRAALAEAIVSNRKNRMEDCMITVLKY
jgi:hypothetical protein